MKDPVFKIPSDSGYIKKASVKILNPLKKFNLDKDTLFDIRLCLEEAIINAIKHGNKCRKGLSVEISYSISDERLEVTICDEGEGFDYNNIPDPRSQKNVLKQGGRGLFLIRNLMDEVRFNDKGSQIKMIKFLSEDGRRKYGHKR